PWPGQWPFDGRGMAVAIPGQWPFDGRGMAVAIPGQWPFDGRGMAVAIIRPPFPRATLAPLGLPGAERLILGALLFPPPVNVAGLGFCPLVAHDSPEFIELALGDTSQPRQPRLVFR